MTENGHKICVGEIVGVHGIKGEVKVKSFTETDRNLERYGTLCDERGRLFEVKVSGHSKELLRVKITDIRQSSFLPFLLPLSLSWLWQI